jgi:hypothetical protein
MRTLIEMIRIAPLGAGLVAGLLFLPGQAAADRPALSFSARLASDLVVSGESITGGRPGAVVAAEIEQAGFFLGSEIRTLRGDDESWEGEIALGYRHGLDRVEFEIGLAQSWVDARDRNDLETYAALVFAPVEGVGFGLGAAYAPEPGDWIDLVVTADFALTDRITLSSTLGRVPVDRLNYASFGPTVAITDAVSAELLLHRSSEVGNRLVFSLDFALGL